MSSFSGPAEVRGFYERWRQIIHGILIVIFIALPWIKFRGRPFLLFDIAERHFIIFGVNFYSHEAPLLFFLLILILLGIFLITALFGRLWCGWVCPQTVFLHSVFNRIEKLFLGTYAKRRTLLSRNSLEKIWKLSVVYVLFFGVCWILTHSFMAYFIGSDVMTRYVQEGPSAHLQIFTILILLTFIFFGNFAFFREHLCNYVCPYGRFQNALIDANSVTVFYDTVRGEPRGKKSSTRADEGDCIDCNRCVTVCPAKIDIRKGFQFECISCAKCIDACNDVMTKIKKPLHLIRYETGNQKKIDYNRFRILLYSLLIVIFLFAFIGTLASRSEVDFGMTRAHETPFVIRSELQKTILQNQFKLHLKNQSNLPLTLLIKLAEKDTQRGFRFISPASSVTLQPQQDFKVPAFIEIDESSFNAEETEIEIILVAPDDLQIKKIKFFKGH